MSAEFGKRLREVRIQSGYTQGDLARKIGVSVNHISAIERGVYETRVDTLAKIVVALDTSADYLIFGIDSDEKPLARAFSKANSLGEEKQAWVCDYLEAILKVQGAEDESAEAGVDADAEAGSDED